MLECYLVGCMCVGLIIEDVVQFKIQNMYNMYLDIVCVMVGVMCEDMVVYDEDLFKFIQLFGCWFGFYVQQKIKVVKCMCGMVKGIYIYLFGWMVVGLCNMFGYLLDQFMYEKIVVMDLICEIYILLCQVDEVVLNDLFQEFKVVKEFGVDQNMLDEIIY